MERTGTDKSKSHSVRGSFNSSHAVSVLMPNTDS